MRREKLLPRGAKLELGPGPPRGGAVGVATGTATAQAPAMDATQQATGEQLDGKRARRSATLSRSDWASGPPPSHFRPKPILVQSRSGWIRKLCERSEARHLQSLPGKRSARAMASPSCASTLPWTSASSLRPSAERRLMASRRAPSLVIVAQGKVKKYRQVILTDDIEAVGKKGDTTKVRAGFYRNFLLPKGKATLLTPEVLKEMQLEQERIEAEKKRVKEDAQQLARVFETIGAFKIPRKGGKGKQIFGSVTAQDVVDIIKSQLNRDVDKKLVTVPEIREIGEYVAEIQLHPDVTAQVRLNVYAK